MYEEAKLRRGDTSYSNASNEEDAGEDSDSKTSNLVKDPQEIFPEHSGGWS